jgi:CHAT domain
VVLNSCHSSRPELGAAPVAMALLDAGVQAVIGAQAAVRIDHARTFSRAFYAALAKGQPVDRAMADARNDLKNTMAGGDRRRLWALPVLTTNAPIGQVLQFTRVAGAVASSEEVREVFARRGRFVNRSADRWKLLSAFRPAGSADLVFRGVILKSGMAQVGKSWLVKRCLRDFTDAGFVVRYASLVSSAAGKTSFDVLDEWRRSLQIGPESGSPFGDFDRALASAGKLPDAKAIVEVFEAFKNGLQRMRQGQPVVLVLERFRQQGRTWVSADGFRELLSKLLLPIRDGVDGNVQGVHALLVARRHENLTGVKDDFEEFGLKLLSDRLDDETTRILANGFRQLTVEEFASEQIGRYVDEFSDFTNDDDIRDVCNKFLRKRANGGLSWSPSELQMLEPVYEAMGGTKGK